VPSRAGRAGRLFVPCLTATFRVTRNQTGSTAQIGPMPIRGCIQVVVDG